MKKIFTLALTVIIIKGSYAQDDFKKFHFGLKVAPGITWIKPSDSSIKNDKAKLSFGYGVMTEFAFTENYSFATGVNINSMRGAFRQNGAINNITYETTTNLKIQYLELPLTLKMKTNEIGYLKYFGQFGIGSNFRLKSVADQKTTIPGNTSSQDDVDVSKHISFFRESLIIALGIEYNLMGNTSMVVSVQYDNGFTKVGKKSIGHFYSKGIMLNAGILF